MKSKSITRYIGFGTTLRYLKDIDPKWPIHDKSSVLDNIGWFLGYLDEFTLPVTKRASYQLFKFKDFHHFNRRTI